MKFKQEIISEISSELRVVSFFNPDDGDPFETRIEFNNSQGFVHVSQNSSSYSECLDDHDEAIVVCGIFLEHLADDQGAAE